MNACSQCGDRSEQTGEAYCFTCRATTQRIPVEQFVAEQDARREAEEREYEEEQDRKRERAANQKDLRSTVPFPNVIGDELHNAPHDWATNKTYKSKAERAADYKANGLVMLGADEMRRKLPDFGKHQRAVRTSTGRIVN